MNQENIYFFIDDNIIDDNIVENNYSDLDLTKLLNIQNNDDDNLCVKLIHYNLNYTVKQLLLICEYYNIAKDLRNNKCNKSDILNTLIIYENNIENLEKVNKRKKIWHYINELKKDKFMKKYLLWD